MRQLIFGMVWASAGAASVDAATAPRPARVMNDLRSIKSSS